jgi:hypothetical protein
VIWTVAKGLLYMLSVVAAGTLLCVVLGRRM